MNRVPTFLMSFALTLPLLAAEPPKTVTLDAGRFVAFFHVMGERTCQGAQD